MDFEQLEVDGKVTDANDCLGWELAGDAVELSDVASNEGDPCAVIKVPVREGPADATRGTRDEHTLAQEIGQLTVLQRGPDLRAILL